MASLLVCDHASDWRARGQAATAGALGWGEMRAPCGIVDALDKLIQLVLL